MRRGSDTAPGTDCAREGGVPRAARTPIVATRSETAVTIHSAGSTSGTLMAFSVTRSNRVPFPPPWRDLA